MSDPTGPLTLETMQALVGDLSAQIDALRDQLIAVSLSTRGERGEKGPRGDTGPQGELVDLATSSVMLPGCATAVPVLAVLDCATAKAAPHKLRYLGHLAGYTVTGNGTTDDSHAIQRALDYAAEHRIPVDGEGLRYRVDTRIDLPANLDLTRATFVDGAPVRGRRILHAEGVDGLRLSDLTLVRAALAAGLDDPSQILDNVGLSITGGSGHRLDGITITGGGIGSGLVMTDAAQFRVSGVSVQGIAYNFATIETEAVHGIYAARNSLGLFERCTVTDLSGNPRGAIQSARTNGIVAVANTACRFVECDVSLVERGFVFLGEQPQVDCDLVDCRARDCLSTGVVVSGAQSRMRLRGVSATRCGLTGFLIASTTVGSEVTPTLDIDLDGCLAIEVGASNALGFTAALVPGTGFSIVPAIEGALYPCAVRFRGCQALSTTGGMRCGFSNAVTQPLAGRESFLDMACRSVGHTVEAYAGLCDPQAWSMRAITGVGASARRQFQVDAYGVITQTNSDNIVVRTSKLNNSGLTGLGQGVSVCEVSLGSDGSSALSGRLHLVSAGDYQGVSGPAGRSSAWVFYQEKEGQILAGLKLTPQSGLVVHPSLWITAGSDDEASRKGVPLGGLYSLDEGTVKRRRT